MSLIFFNLYALALKDKTKPFKKSSNLGLTSILMNCENTLSNTSTIFQMFQLGHTYILINWLNTTFKKNKSNKSSLFQRIRVGTHLDLDELIDHSAVGGDENVSLESVVENERAREQPHVDPLRVLTLLGISHLQLIFMKNRWRISGNILSQGFLSFLVFCQLPTYFKYLKICKNLNFRLITEN